MRIELGSDPAASAPLDQTRWDRKRLRILDCAATTLSRRGVAGTTVAAVAREAKVNTSAIYYYFPSREALIEEVIVLGTHRLQEQLRDALGALPPDATALDRIDAAIEMHLRQLLAESGFAHAVIRNLSQLPEAVRGRQEEEERKYNALWRALFTDAANRGEIDSNVDVRVAHLLLVGTLNWATEWWDPNRGDLAKLIGDAQSMFRIGIVANRTPLPA